MIRDMIPGDAPETLRQAVAGRAAIFDMVDTAERAVLTPADPGGIPHAMRHALAARIARAGGQEDLAERYARGAGPLDAQTPIVQFMDRVAGQTRDVTAAEVADLIASGVAEADVVRLCELNAFVSFQLRLRAGLRVLEGGA